MIMKHLTLVTGLLLAIAPPARAAGPSTGAVTVPFELLKTKHMVVRIKVNGKGPYRVIFDTGAPVMLLNNKIAKESGVLPKNFKPTGFQLFGTAGQFPIKTLELGDLKAEDVPAVVMDHPALEEAAKVLGPLDGIVGFPFFARYAMTLDYQARQLTFVPSGFKPPDTVQSLLALMLAGGGQPAAKTVLAPAAQWGFVVHKDAGDGDAGVSVKAVLPGGAAAAAGLQAGDRLLTLDDRWTDSVADCYAAAGHVKPGTAAKVVIQRGGKEMELIVTPRPGL
jgi:hypothetical protein